MFLQVAGQARAAKQSDREQVARKRGADLEPKLSRLAIVVPPQSEVTGLQVTRDGAPIGRGSWGSGVAVDPGEHVVGASAPGRRNWQMKVVVAKPGATEPVTVPALEAIAAVPSASPAAPERVAPRDRRTGNTVRELVQIGRTFKPCS